MVPAGIRRVPRIGLNQAMLTEGRTCRDGALRGGFTSGQEAYGPASTGWTPSWPSMKVAGVTRGGPMDKAGERAGDVVEGKLWL